MPSSTPIFGFPYPIGTDPIAQGDNVIQQLAEDVETVITTGMGMRFIANLDFASTTTIELDNVFTTNYLYYKLVSYVANATAGTMNFQFRAGGSNLAAASYNYRGISQNFTSGPGANQASSQTQAFFAYAGSSLIFNEMTIFTPALSTGTTGFINTSYSPASNGWYTSVSGAYQVATAADGIRIVTAANATGNIKVYGFSN